MNTSKPAPPRKLRADSRWSGLPNPQRAAVEDWLFEQRLGYKETLARLHSQFGLEASVASIGRYYRRRVAERENEAETLGARAAESAIQAMVAALTGHAESGPVKPI